MVVSQPTVGSELNDETMKKIGVIIPTELRGDLFHPEDVERLDRLGEVSWTDASKQLSTATAIDLLAEDAAGGMEVTRAHRPAMTKQAYLKFQREQAQIIQFDGSS